MFCSWPFFAQFQVVEEEPHSPGERLVQGLGQCHRHHGLRVLALDPAFSQDDFGFAIASYPRETTTSSSRNMWRPSSGRDSTWPWTTPPHWPRIGGLTG